MSRFAAALLMAILVSTTSLSAAHAQSATDSTIVKVYGDGTAVITQVISTPANDTSVTLPLLSSIIANPVVLDQRGSGLYFQISGTNITIYTIGATEVTLEYATGALTSKQGTLWKVDLTAYYNTTVVLPQQSTIVSLSGTPDSVSLTNGSPSVVVSPGTWEIDYGVPVEAVAASSASSTAESGMGSSTTSVGVTPSNSSAASLTASRTTSSSGSPLFGAPVAPLLVAAVVVAAVVLRLARRRSVSAGSQTVELRPDDAKVIDFIEEKGGKVLEPEIRMQFALPKTSAWRQIKRLERLGFVRVTKIGSQNQVELLRKRENR